MDGIDLVGKRVVVALGGNALGDDPVQQLKRVDSTAGNIASMVKEGIDVVVTHGNGPQVGIIDQAFEVAREYIAQGQFAPGSMLPKVQACVEFVEAHPGGKALIASLGHAVEGLRGQAGTLIVATD